MSEAILRGWATWVLVALTLSCAEGGKYRAGTADAHSCISRLSSLSPAGTDKPQLELIACATSDSLTSIDPVNVYIAILNSGRRGTFFRGMLDVVGAGARLSADIVDPQGRSLRPLGVWDFLLGQEYVTIFLPGRSMIVKQIRLDCFELDYRTDRDVQGIDACTPLYDFNAQGTYDIVLSYEYDGVLQGAEPCVRNCPWEGRLVSEPIEIHIH